MSITGDRESFVELGGLTNVSWLYAAPDGRLFFRVNAADGSGGIYAMDQAGGEPRVVVRFDDPRIVPANLDITIRGNSLVLTVSEKESEIYVMELEY